MLLPSFFNWIYFLIWPQSRNYVSLPQLQIDPDGIAISGFSSGGFVCQQMYLAHSEIFTGMAALSAGPYLCAEATGHTSIVIRLKMNVSNNKKNSPRNREQFNMPLPPRMDRHALDSEGKQIFR